MVFSESICDLVKQSDVSKLSFTNKSFYQAVRPILFHHPKISSFSSLVLFSRTISEATYLGKADRRWSEQDCLNQTKSLSLTIDPVLNDGQTVCHSIELSIMCISIGDALKLWSLILLSYLHGIFNPFCLERR